MIDFQVAGGSVIGLDHLHVGRSNQDAYAILQGEDHIIAVVADGCSEGAHSEVGAHLQARMLAAVLRHWLHRGVIPEQLWNIARMDVEDALHRVVLQLGGVGGDAERRCIVNDYLLATLVAICITPTQTDVACIGDGFFAVNGQSYRLGPFENNAPPYLAYKVTGTALPSSRLVFTVVRSLPTAELESFAIGTDGVNDFVDAAEQLVPGSDRLLINTSPERIGPVSQFWTEDRYFKNPDMLRRRLAIVNGGAGIPQHRGGPLHDDTTLVVGRRRPKQVTP